MYGGIMFSLDDDFGGIFVRKNHISFEFGNGFAMDDPDKFAAIVMEVGDNLMSIFSGTVSVKEAEDDAKDLQARRDGWQTAWQDAVSWLELPGDPSPAHQSRAAVPWQPRRRPAP